MQKKMWAIVQFFINWIQQLQRERDEWRYYEAVQEVEELSRSKKGTLPSGFIVRTHRLIFEWNHIGWILRPYDYFERVEMLGRFPRRRKLQD